MKQSNSCIHFQEESSYPNTEQAADLVDLIVPIPVSIFGKRSLEFHDKYGPCTILRILL